MENVNEKEELELEQEGYVPRPKWQVWCARIGLVLVILFVIYQIMQIAGGWQ